MKQTISVDQYDKLIHKMAWKYGDKWDIEESDMYAEGLYIFVLSLALYDISKKCKFITYLYNRLRSKLDKYGKREQNYRYKQPLMSFTLVDDSLLGCTNIDLNRDIADWHNHKELSGNWYELFIKNLEYCETITTELSRDARNVLELILQSLENVTYNRRPSLSGAVKHFQLFNDWAPARTSKAWMEVKKWWLDFNMKGCRV